jgi:hypothetical protein
MDEEPPGEQMLHLEGNVSNWRQIAISLVDRVNAQIHFRESEEVVVCHFRKVFNIDQLLEPRSGYSGLSFNKRNTVMG